MRSVRLGIDVGGSKLLACAAGEGSHARIVARHPTGRGTGPDAVITHAASLCRERAAAGERVTAIGVAFPGLVDDRAGLVRSSVMLDGWRDVPLAARIAAACDVPCAVDNDANAAARGELATRAGDVPDGSWLFVAVGTGIGGAAFAGRTPVRGASRHAGEIGHLLVDRAGDRCWCGRRGCLNTIASGSAIERRAGAPPGTLAARFLAGDPAIRTTVRDGARALGAALADALHLLSPALIVLGGGVAALGAPWLDEVQRAIAAEAMPEIAAACRVEPARAGYEAAALGAALLAGDTLAARDTTTAEAP